MKSVKGFTMRDKKSIISYCQAINQALIQLMERDRSVFIMGLGVDDPKRVFGSTLGLSV